MTKTPMLEMSEGTYATLWNALVKTGDNDAVSLFKEVVHKQITPVLHYAVAKDLLFGFIDDIVKSGDLYHANMILKNCRNGGYHKKYYGNGKI
jgi:hypothetical protein